MGIIAKPIGYLLMLIYRLVGNYGISLIILIRVFNQDCATGVESSFPICRIVFFSTLKKLFQFLCAISNLARGALSFKQL